MNRLDRKVPHLFENPRIILLANQLHDVGTSRQHERTPMVPVAWSQMTKKEWVRKDRDPKDFVSPNRSAGERCEQRETSKADEFRKAVHEECYVLKIKQRTAHFLPFCLRTGVIGECQIPARNFFPGDFAADWNSSTTSRSCKRAARNGRPKQSR